MSSDQRSQSRNPQLVVDRRTALSALGLFGSALVLGCGGSTTGLDGGDGSTSAADGGTCAVTPEGEIGPYFADDSATGFNRSNVLSNLDGSGTQAGVPLTLKIYIYDSEKSCAPVAGSQVDIWHCNASGVYSDVAAQSTTTQNWLRGYQITDATGLVTFLTIIPGWYAGRTSHIHLRIRSSYSEASSTMDGTNTTQVFFPQTLVNMLSTSVAPYNTEGTNPTTNANDRVYTSETKGETLLTLTGSVALGYTATFSVYLPITSA